MASSLVAVRGLCCQLPLIIWDLSSPTRDQTQVPCIGRWVLNPWTHQGSPPILLFDRELGYEFLITAHQKRCDYCEHLISDIGPVEKRASAFSAGFRHIDLALLGSNGTALPGCRHSAGSLDAHDRPPGNSTPGHGCVHRGLLPCVYSTSGCVKLWTGF